MLITKNRARKARGFTLTEAAIVLGIVGLILGAIWVAAASVYNNMRVNTSQRQYLAIAQGIRSLYATQATIDAAATVDILRQAGVFPADMINGTAVSDVWNGAIAISRETSPGGVAGDAFGIQFSNVPQSACVSLLTAMTGQSRDAGLLGAAAATSSQGAGTPATSNNMATIGAATAVGQCTSAAANFVKVVFRLRG